MSRATAFSMQCELDSRDLGRPTSKELQQSISEQASACTMEVKIRTDTALRMVRHQCGVKNKILNFEK